MSSASEVNSSISCHDWWLQECIPYNWLYYTFVYAVFCICEYLTLKVLKGERIEKVTKQILTKKKYTFDIECVTEIQSHFMTV